MKKLSKIIAACCAVLMLAGCSTQTSTKDMSKESSLTKTSKSQETGDATETVPAETVQTESASGEINVTDLCGREVTLEKPAERVVLTFNFEEYFAVTGEEGISKIVGWSRKYWEGRRQSSWDVFTEKFPELKDIPDVGYVPKNTFNVETVISLKPDLVLMAKNDYESVQTDLERLNAAGIPVIFVDYHLQTMDNHTNSTLLIGKVMGKEQQAQALVDFYKEQTDIVTERMKKAGADLEKPKVYVEFSEAAGPGTFGASYGKQMWGALIDQCGGDNITRDLVEGASAPVMPEQVLAANPDIIIFAGNQFADSDVNVGLGYTSDKETAARNLKSYGDRPGWSEINAVKNGQMYALYHDLSRHIFDFAGLQYFAKTIHPELFEDLDPDKNLKEFHDKFYPVEYKGTWFVSLED
ncbi:ABC transporter substrate-binding protein [Clostridium sp. chh4-2]|uniref:ABC transporter substrate-binding protein n=1 Tax=Clostridium sp. chh4-2 TaxID=2067550 RepID=UPI0011AEF0FF|nr:ABC transporter substrate-binding protein [Clostridium sp. chh4-2]